MLASPREHVRHLHDSGRGNPRLRFGPFGRLVEKLLVPPRAHPARESLLERGLIHPALELGRLGKEVLAALEIADIVAVPKPLGENHAGNGGREGAVGSGNNGDPATGVGAIPCEGIASLRTTSSRTTRLLLDELGRHRAARVDDVNRRTATKSLGKGASGVRLLAVRRDRIGSPQDGALQVFPVVIVVVVCPIHRTGRQLFCIGADGIMIEAVRRTVYLGKNARQHLVDAGRAPLRKREALRMPRTTQRHHPIGKLVKRFIPGHGLELGIDPTALSRVAATQRRRHAVGVIFLLQRDREGWARTPARRRARRVAANPHRAAAFHRDEHGAVRQTPLASR